MDNVKQVKSFDFFQTLVNEVPDTFILPIDFTHSVNSPSTGSVQKFLRTLGFRTETTKFTYIAIPTHYTLVGNKLTPARTSKGKRIV